MKQKEGVSRAVLLFSEVAKNISVHNDKQYTVYVILSQGLNITNKNLGTKCFQILSGKVTVKEIKKISGIVKNWIHLMNQMLHLPCFLFSLLCHRVHIYCGQKQITIIKYNTLFKLIMGDKNTDSRER